MIRPVRLGIEERAHALPAKFGFHSGTQKTGNPDKFCIFLKLGCILSPVWWEKGCQSKSRMRENTGGLPPIRNAILLQGH